VIPKGDESRHRKETPHGRKTTNHMNKSTKEAAQEPRNRLSTRFAYSAGFPSWLGFLNNFSTFLEAYQVAECVSRALEDGQPIEGLP